MMKTDTGVARHWVREGIFIGLLAVGVYLLSALLTFDPADPGWSRTGGPGAARNAMGASGAWFADVLFSLFGVMAYLFPLMLFLRGWLIFQDRDPEYEFEWVTLVIRVIGFTLVMVSATCLVALNIQAFSVLPFGQGGVFGKELADVSLGAFNLLGSRLIMLAIGLFGLTIFTDISWLKLMDQLGSFTMNKTSQFWGYAQHRIDQWHDKRQLKEVAEKRRENVEVHMEKRKLKPAPTIAPLPAKPAPSERVQKEKQGRLFDTDASGDLPGLGLLDEAQLSDRKGFSKEALEALSRLLEIKLADFGIEAEVTAVYPGPVITRFEIQPAAGTKASRITNLARDLARSLAVISVRVVEVIPGKSVVGIEIPNEDREVVFLRDVLSSRAYEKSKSPITIALGHDISGEPVVADLAKMPHLLVAGTTGSGKSVGVNAMLLSLLYKAGPDEVRLLLVDPKMLELSVYDGIPHLLTPVITDMKDAANGLRWCVAEMERRYKLMAALGVRNVAGYNKKIDDAISTGQPLTDPLWVANELLENDTQAPELERLPMIVVVIDEFADMMMIVGKKVEQLIARIAQKARAAGIHLILATQRPSVDVITGLIKANVPTRIAFQVSSKVDSRTILDQGGGEQLLGHGDMLYLPPGSGMPVRVHGAFVADEEVHRVVEDWKKRGKPNFIEGLLDDGASSGDMVPGMGGTNDNDEESDPLYDEAVAFVTETRKASISSVQRKLRIGYNRAARMVEAMELAGVVTEMGSNGNREVLAAAPPRD
ncbi:MAG: DNA translocase FtsK 4TM domain-containing protein [Pseudomonadota bacterium]